MQLRWYRLGTNLQIDESVRQNEDDRRKQSMRIKFWGVRGSTPTPQPENLRYGGNTACVEVRCGNGIFIFDCGTGLRVLGLQLRREFENREVSAHVLVSHFHW